VSIGNTLDFDDEVLHSASIPSELAARPLRRKRKRNLKKSTIVVKKEFKRVKDLLPYT